MKRTLLIVDDIKLNREILKNILGDDYTIVEAEHGQEALAVMSGSHRQLSAVLLDLGMPIMDGYEVLEYMQKSEKLKQLPVIITTGQTDSESEEKALRMGAVDYISKPYKSAIIKQRIHNTIVLRETAATVNALLSDSLTGLYSRSAFFEKVSEMAESHESGYYTMACFDVDKFKVINDQYGTQKGDEVLRHIAGVFKAGFESHGGICCRIAADDFAVFYPTAFQNSRELFEIREKAGTFKGLVTPIVFSIGRYVVDDTSMTPSAMYDRALLAANSIKGHYDTHIAVYDETMRSNLLREQNIVMEMESALHEKQFEVWYQPQYNHSNGALIGAEALVRWNHPEKGLISPGVFIPVFEQNGFIYELDKYVWECVCRYLRAELDAGRAPAPISVNISRCDVFKSDLTEFIFGLVRDYGIPTRLLRLEITESAFSENTEVIVSVVKKLIDFGFTLEIDDFGSGYSSLNTLKSVPAQVVKLDMRFLEDDDGSQRGGNIIESIVRMTKWLGMSVLAEGVETIEQADYLKSIGCSYVQGYLYAKPMREADYNLLCEKMGKEEHLLTLETVKNLDNNTFWDPNSMDTLIFNSYVGGACIYEYHDGETEILRANDKYAQMLGGENISVEDALAIKWRDYLDEETYKRLLCDIDEAVKAKSEVTGEYIFLDLPSCPHETYLRFTMRVIAFAGSRFLIYCMCDNITPQRQSEKREREGAEEIKLIMANVNGGICAAQYVDNDTVRIVFANDMFYSMYGYTKEQFEAEVGDVYKAIVPSDRQRIKDTVAEVVRTRGKATLDYCCRKRNGATINVRCNNTATTFGSYEGTVLLSVITDTTELTLAQNREKQTAERMQAVMDNVDLGIIAVVVGDGEAQYIFANERYYKMLGYTNEQFEAEIHSPYQTIAQEDRSRVMEQTAKLKSIGQSTVLEYNALTRDNRAMVLRAAISMGTFEGINAPVQLSIIRDITAEKESEQREKLAAAQISAMMDDMPGGFVRMQVFPDNTIKPIYFNQGFHKLTGMNYDELMARHQSDASLGVHPDDEAKLHAAVDEMLRLGEAHSERYRLRRGDGSYVWLIVFGRTSEGMNGERFLNTYYTEVTDEVNEEERQRELLDNMPYGVALYEYDGKELSVIHLSRRYWELVNRSAEKYFGAGFLNSLHPDDRALTKLELEAAVREGRDMNCDVRILYGEDDYRPFHITARIIKKRDGKYIAYFVYTPISREEMSVQEMLPVALEAVMSSQSDFTFVKDKNLRYVCCSRGAAELIGLSEDSSIRGKTDYDVMDKEIADIFADEDKQILESGEAIIEKETVLPSRDGLYHYALTSKYPLKDSDGRIIGIYGMGHDITETKTMRSQLELLANSIPGGIATYEYQNGKVTAKYFNEGFCNIFGLTYDESYSENIDYGICKEDMRVLKKQLDDLAEKGTPIDCVCRVHPKNGSKKWINIKASLSVRSEEKVVFNAVLFDVTKRQEAVEKLRVSEEENRLAMQHTRNTICRYDVGSGTLKLPEQARKKYGFGSDVINVPYEQVQNSEISMETADAYIEFYEDIRRGSKAGVATYQRKSKNGWRWLEAHYSTIFSADAKPVSAVISFVDITEQLEKESAYKRWQQSFEGKDTSSYSLFRCNLSKKTTIDSREGKLLEVEFGSGEFYFDDHTSIYAQSYVFEDDSERFRAFLNVDALLSGYYKGNRFVSIEYREKTKDSKVRWLRLSIEMVEHGAAANIEAYLLFENIDKAKRQEISTLEKAQTDPLTGVLNRISFASRVNSIITTSAPNTQHALLMLDMDGFKQINDTFGHSTGDQSIIDIAASLRSVLHHEDLLGRLGGDEFLIFIPNIAGDVIASNKAKQICALVRKAYSVEVEVSGSIGIAVTPRDGSDFDSLYKKADAALYHVKGSGKDSYAFYMDDMADEHLVMSEDERNSITTQPNKKRRMLIVDDSKIDHALLTSIFSENFIVEKAKDGNSALIRLRHYGSAISVVLLDLVMPGMDGFAVLRKMRESKELASIPVIVVSSDETRETSLRAIREGAVDFVLKPVDPEVLRIRVQSAISKADNERLRAKNSFLEYQNSEITRYKTALDASGTAVIENDWVAGTFIYDTSLTEHIAGKYDNRGFWHILLSDFVAETQTVQKMQSMVQEVASDHAKKTAALLVQLKTPSNVKHWFRMYIHKTTNDFGFAGKIYMVFTDLGEKRPLE